MQVSFAKYEGLGNAFLLVDRMGNDKNSPPLSPEHVQRLCDHHRGVGADGVILVSPPKNTQTIATMELFNADGGLAEISGNGLRCLALWLQHRRRIAAGKSCLIATDAGPRQVSFTPDGIRVEMGRAHVDWTRPLSVILSDTDPCHPFAVAQNKPGEHSPSCHPDERSEEGSPQPAAMWGDSSPVLHYCSGQTQNDRGGGSHRAQDDKEITAVTLGNPHVIIHTPKTGSEDLTAHIGQACQKSPLFPEGVNVSMCTLVDRTTIKLTTYERGVGLTPACGSGACAAVAALIHRNELPVDQEITVRQPGGALIVRQDTARRLWLTGPARRICEGTAFLNYEL
ncbi:MAG: diaminopimelate epimerase [Myxococcota bacterium]